LTAAGVLARDSANTEPNLTEPIERDPLVLLRYPLLDVSGSGTERRDSDLNLSDLN